MHSTLIIGCGSIGERHLRCFQKTGRSSVTACDTNPALLVAMRERYGAPGFATLDEALVSGSYDAAVICTPAHLHLPMALTLLAKGMHLLIEKPLALDTTLVPQVRAAIAQAQRFVGIAYVYHFMPWISESRGYLQSGALGRVLHASIVTGQHFPTFRPAYRDIYYARHEHGGGAIQDALTHVVNAVEWMIGPCTRLFCDASHQMLEGVTVEDTVNVSARHGEALVSYSLNQFQAANETVIVLHGEHGSVKIEVNNRRWGHLQRGESDWTWHETPAVERDDWFINQANAFLDGAEGRANALATFEEAVQTLKVNHAALHSVHTGLPLVIE
jgi:predicted dehydrogenase